MSSSNNMEEFPPLETKRLVLREMRPEDAEAIFHILGDEEVMRYHEIPAFTRLEEAQQSLEWMRARRERGEGMRWELLSRERTLLWEVVDTPGI